MGLGMEMDFLQPYNFHSFHFTVFLHSYKQFKVNSENILTLELVTICLLPLTGMTIES